MPGHSDTTASPLLDRQQTDLLGALPPVVTGVDIDSVFDGWQRSSLLMKGPTASRTGEGGHNSIGRPGYNDREAGDPLDGSSSRDALAGVDLSSVQNAPAVEAIVETRLPSVSIDLDGGTRTADDATAAGSTLGVGMEEIRSHGHIEMPAASGLPKVEGGEDAAAEAAEAKATTPGYLEAYVPPSGVGLTRLCRRAVILLTRSPACPDLVALQPHPAEQRTYDQMEPLLSRANMTHKDLHPRLVGFPDHAVTPRYIF